MMLLNETRPSWFDDAACADADVDLFFQPRGMRTGGPSPYREARAYCVRCPVQADCLQYAIDNKVRHGYWGNATERQRRRMKRATQ